MWMHILDWFIFVSAVIITAGIIIHRAKVKDLQRRKGISEAMLTLILDSLREDPDGWAIHPGYGRFVYGNNGAILIGEDGSIHGRYLTWDEEYRLSRAIEVLRNRTFEEQQQQLLNEFQKTVKSRIAQTITKAAGK